MFCTDVVVLELLFYFPTDNIFKRDGFQKQTTNLIKKNIKKLILKLKDKFYLFNFLVVYLCKSSDLEFLLCVVYFTSDTGKTCRYSFFVICF